MTSDNAPGRSSWRQVAAVIDGKRVPVGPGAVLTVDGGIYTVTVNGKVYQRGTSKSDLEQTPHHADVTVAEGPNAGKTHLQIFKIEGEVLISCVAPPGAARPLDFTSQPGSGHALSVWLRSRPGGLPAAGPRTWRFWLLIAMLVVLASLVGSVGGDLAAALGRWAGLLAGGLAGTLMVMAVCLLLKWDWRTALTVAITAMVATTTFEEVKSAVAPSLAPLAALAVSGSTALVAGFFMGAVLARLFKLDWWRLPQ